MVGVEDEQQVERLGHRIQFQRLARHLEHHVQEAGDVFEVVARVADRPADRGAVGRRGDRRHLGEQADRGEATLLGIVDVEGVVVERRQRGDRGGQDGHRVGVVVEAAEEVLLRLVHHRVMRDLVLEIRELRLVGQLAVDQQVGHLEEARLLGQLLDRVAAVEQDALVAVDEGDGAARARGRDEAGVVGEVAGVLVEPGDVDGGIAERTGDDRQGGAAVAGDVGDLDGLLGHG